MLPNIKCLIELVVLNVFGLVPLPGISLEHTLQIAYSPFQTTQNNARLQKKFLPYILVGSSNWLIEKADQGSESWEYVC